MPKVVPVSDEDFARIKREVEARAVRYEVTGSAGVRDCVTREIVRRGGIVRLDPEVPANAILVRTGAVKPAADVKAAKADAKG